VSGLARTIDAIAVEASTMCTQCLIDYVTEESGELQDKVNDLADASLERDSGPDGDARYHQAFADVMSTVAIIAVFTAELSNHRDVAWRDTGPASTLIISPN